MHAPTSKLLALALLLAAACTPKPVATPDAIDDVADTTVADADADVAIDTAMDAAITDTLSPSDIVDTKDTVDVAVPDVDAWVDPPLDVTEGSPDGMVYIPGGTFWMGCNEAKVAPLKCNPNSLPQHKVTLSSYYMDPLEVTRAMYAACIDAGFCSPPGNPSVPLNWPIANCPVGAALYSENMDRPVVCVSREQARRYCQWRGNKFDLPTEAQWEMAARGDCEHNGSTADDPGCALAMRMYPWGDVKPTPKTGCDYAVMSIDVGGSPLCLGYSPCVKDGCAEPPNIFPNLRPGGTKPKGDSPYGLHDMAGNADEWVREDYAAYPALPIVDPIGKVTVGAEGVARGGDTGSYESFNDWLGVDSTLRYIAMSSGRGAGGGFRCARVAD